MYTHTHDGCVLAGRSEKSRDVKPFKDKVLHVTGAIFGQHKHSVPRDSWDDDARLLSEASSTDPAHLAAFEGAGSQGA